MRRFLILIAAFVTAGIFLLGSRNTSLKASRDSEKHHAKQASPSLAEVPTPLPTPDGVTQLNPRLVADDEEDEDEDVISRGPEDMISSFSLSTPTPLATLPPYAPTPSDAHSGSEDESGVSITIPETDGNNKESKSSRGGPPLFPASSGGGTSGEPTPIPSVTTETQLDRVSGQPRGYAMLYLMQPNAREAVERELQIMLDSQVQDLYLSALIDGTFSQDFGYLSTVVKKLNTDNRTLTLALYFVSGPTMRRYDRPYVTTLFSRIDPIAFRSLIEYDAKTRSNVAQIGEKAKIIFEENRKLNSGNQNFAIPMLEDNLDLQSYRVMRSLLGSVLTNSANFIRNPCPGCYDGNDSESAGDPVETHSLNEFQSLPSGDAFTLDGNSVAYPGEPTNGKISLDTLRSMLDRSVAQNHRYFGLWRVQRQGNGDITAPLAPPSERTYEVATDEQRTIEIDLLRRGLTSSTDDGSDDAVTSIN